MTCHYLSQWWYRIALTDECVNGYQCDACLRTLGQRWRVPRTWWRHQMETFSASLAICAGNSPVHGEFPAQRPVTRSFDVFFDLRLNKRLSKQPWGWWFETQSLPLWRHHNESPASHSPPCYGHGRVDDSTTHFSTWLAWKFFVRYSHLWILHFPTEIRIILWWLYKWFSGLFCTLYIALIIGRLIIGRLHHRLPSINQYN